MHSPSLCPTPLLLLLFFFLFGKHLRKACFPKHWSLHCSCVHWCRFCSAGSAVFTSMLLLSHAWHLPLHSIHCHLPPNTSPLTHDTSSIFLSHQAEETNDNSLNTFFLLCLSILNSFIRDSNSGTKRWTYCPLSLSEMLFREISLCINNREVHCVALLPSVWLAFT